MFDGGVVVLFREFGNARDPMKVDVLCGVIKVGCRDVHVSEVLVVFDGK